MLSDRDIRSLISEGRLIVEPGTYRVGENGLDLSVGREYCVLREHGKPVELLSPPPVEELYDCRVAGDEGILVPAHGRVLLHTVERVRLPWDVAGIVGIRSTYARYGLAFPVTVVDAGFDGQITLELIGTSFPVIIAPGERMVHLVLFKTSTPVWKPYDGRYYGQEKVRLPKYVHAGKDSSTRRPPREAYQ